MYVCPSVCALVTSCYCIKTAGWVKMVIGTEASLGLSYTLCYEEILVSPKVKGLFSGTLSVPKLRT